MKNIGSEIEKNKIPNKKIIKESEKIFQMLFSFRSTEP